MRRSMSYSRQPLRSDQRADVREPRVPAADIILPPAIVEQLAAPLARALVDAVRLRQDATIIKPATEAQ